MSAEGERDLFAYAQERGAAALLTPAPTPVPSFIKDHLDDRGKAFGDPLADWIEFNAWLHTPAGGEIANAFIRYAHQIRKSGWTNYSAQGVIEAIRWNQHLEHGPDATGFKIAHTWRRRLAIWAMLRDKDLEGFFRVMNREEGAAV
jgi:hypothetical protein